MRSSSEAKRRRDARRRGNTANIHRAEPLECRRLFAVLTVNTAADNAVFGDAVLTLREAIEVVDGTLPYSFLSTDEKAQVNLTQPLGTDDTIDFNIFGLGEHTIGVDSLPAITHPVTIDGYSQPGALAATDSAPANILIRLNNTSDQNFSGLEIHADQTTVRGLAIDNFGTAGITLEDGAQGDVIAGNYLGVTADGTSAEGNSSGIYIFGASGATIGGTTPADRNIIGGNGRGISVTQSQSDVIEGNYIGTGVTGTDGTLPNDDAGIYLSNVQGVTIGGTDATSRNIISNNGGDGIEFDGRNSTALSCTIENNYIGTDVTGAVALGNGAAGIEIIGGGDDNGPTQTNVTIGGGDQAGNVISGNDGTGIYIHDTGASGNTILGNRIGIATDDETAMPNHAGISILNSDDNAIGSDIPGEFNVIDNNTTDGIVLNNASQTTIQGNLIGVVARGTGGGNGGDGIHIVGNSQQNTIGNDVDDNSNLAANAITQNAGAGIEISSSNGANPALNTIRTNAIDGNGGLGIKLDDADVEVAGPGVIANDAGDADTGANGLQNFPVITSVSSPDADAYVTIAGQFNSTPNASFAVDFYGDPAADASGYGQGRSYLGTISVLTDANGNATFNTSQMLAISDAYVTATATTDTGQPNGDTSEFSQAVRTGTTNTSGGGGGGGSSTTNAARVQTLKGELSSLQAESHSFSGSKQQVAAIKKELAAASHLLTKAGTLVKKQTAITAQYTKESNLIAALNAQLAQLSSGGASVKVSTAAKIQKKINADTVLQNRFSSQATSAGNSASTLLDSLATAESTLQSRIILT